MAGEEEKPEEPKTDSKGEGEGEGEGKDEILDRRRFLKTTSALGAGLALGATSCTPNASPGKEMGGNTAAEGSAPVTPPGKVWLPGRQQRPGAPAIVPAGSLVEDIHVALIGCGMQGRVLLTSIFKEPVPGIRFKALCEFAPYGRAFAYNILRKVYRQDLTGHVYEDYRELLDGEKEIDAAIVATPDWMHAEHSIACMQAGLDVYCEAPMSNDVAQARRMLEVSRETGKHLQIGHQRRSNPRYRFACERLLREARLPGRITHAHAQWNRSVCTSGPMQIARRLQPTPEILEKFGYESLDAYCNWRWYRKHGGGPFCALGTHQIDVLGWFLGARPAKVVVNGGRDYWGQQENAGYEWYDNVRAIYEIPTRDGLVRAQYQSLSTTSAMGYFESLMGTEGSLYISESPARCFLHAEGHMQCNASGEHPWTRWEKKGYLRLRKAQRRYEEFDDDPFAPSGMSDLLRLYTPTPVPAQYAMYETSNTTLHGPHLLNFFNAMRSKEPLNCDAWDGHATAVQLLRVNQLLDAGQDAGRFEESDFRA